MALAVVRVPTMDGQVIGVQRQVGGEVLGEDVTGRFGVRSLDLDLHVEATGSQDGRVDHVLSIGGPDDDDVLQPLDPVDLSEQLRDDRGFDVAGTHPSREFGRATPSRRRRRRRGNLVGLLASPLKIA